MKKLGDGDWNDEVKNGLFSHADQESYYAENYRIIIMVFAGGNTLQDH